MSIDEMIKIISNLGFPIAIAMGLGYTIWRLGNRIVDAQVRTLDKACDRFDSVAESMANINESQSKICSRLDQMASEMGRICKSSSR